MSEPTPEPTPEAPVQGTSYELVQRLKAEGATREAMLEALKARGHPEEDAKVLVNSVVGRLPEELPGAQLSPGTNPLSPGVFSLSDIGLTGPSHVVGLYWMGFGAAILLALGVGGILTASGLVELPDDVGFYALRLGGVVAMACLAWGTFRYTQGVTIRRK